MTLISNVTLVSLKKTMLHLGVSSHSFIREIYKLDGVYLHCDLQTLKVAITAEGLEKIAIFEIEKLRGYLKSASALAMLSICKDENATYLVDPTALVDALPASVRTNISRIQDKT